MTETERLVVIVRDDLSGLPYHVICETCGIRALCDSYDEMIRVADTCCHSQPGQPIIKFYTEVNKDGSASKTWD